MRKIHIVSLSLLSTVAVWACSSGGDDGTAQGGAAITGNDENSPSPTASSSASAAPSPAPSASSDGGAGSNATDPCMAACDQQHPAGVKAEKTDDDAFRACLCGPSACGSACGSTKVCTDTGTEPAEGDACFTCMDSPNAGVCDGQGSSACDAEPDCKALEDCYDACPMNAAADAVDGGPY